MSRSRRGERPVRRRHGPRAERGHLHTRRHRHGERRRQLHDGRGEHDQHPLDGRDKGPVRQRPGERHHQRRPGPNRTEPSPGSAISVSGQIWSPTESINGDHNDTIGLTNVTTGTNATVTTTHGTSTINVGSITPFDSGVLANIQGPLAVNGDGMDILNLDDTGDSTKQSAFLTATKLTGLGMAATGVAYSGLGYLNLKLGTAV